MTKLEMLLRMIKQSAEVLFAREKITLLEALTCFVALMLPFAVVVILYGAGRLLELQEVCILGSVTMVVIGFVFQILTGNRSTLPAFLSFWVFIVGGVVLFVGVILYEFVPLIYYYRYPEQL